MKEDGRSDEGRGAGGDKDTCAGKDEDEADAEENRVKRGRIRRKMTRRRRRTKRWSRQDGAGMEKGERKA